MKELRSDIVPEVMQLLRENDRRVAEIEAKFNPITGEGSICFKDRQLFDVKGFPIKMWLPKEMFRIPLIKQLLAAGSLAKFFDIIDEENTEEAREVIIATVLKLRSRYDFAFWAAFYVYIKNKEGGEDVLFRLTRPQRRLVERLEAKRKAGKPIRLVLLKARQWGGSTCIQLYMAWLQLCHRVGLNSLIVAHQGTASDEILDMYDRMIKAYPLEMLHKLADEYTEKEQKWVGVGHSGSIHRVPQRNCKIKIGTAERPDSARGGDYSLVHCSEVGLWKKTEGKSPEDIVRSACSGVLYKAYTMIVYESTANGTGNFFQREYDAAKQGKSQFEALFIAWFDIDLYTLPFETKAERNAFAQWLWENRNNKNANSNREEPGQYLWWLWEKGATLEAIHWYVEERKKYTDHAYMASEYPSDDVEAFVHSGAMVFDKYKVERFRKACQAPSYIGDVYGKADTGKDAFKDLKFTVDKQGMLWVWEKPEIDPKERILHRYLVVVDIGGRGKKSDWSVITVFDRLFMMDGDRPSVVAQWYGHIDMDLLSWKAAQIAAWYDNALLVIESNTLETHDRDRSVDGDQSSFILNQIKDYYPNLYARKQSEEDIREKRPKKYGWHTNVLTKPMIISTLVKVIREFLYVERDERCLDEYLVYERKQNGAFGAIIGKHDDLLMTRAIGLHICFNEMPLPKIVDRPQPGKPRTKRQKVISAATI